MTLPGRFPGRLGRASTLLFHYEPDGTLVAPTGQALTFTRATVGGGLADTLGYVRQPIHSQPKFEAVDLDGDGIRETTGLLLEPTRTNDCPRSEDFTNWSAIRVSVTSNVQRAPDGTLTADKIAETATTGSHECEINPLTTPTASTYSSLSVWLKAGERTWGQISAFRKDGTSSTSYFDLINGVVGTVGANARARIERYADGWYRCCVSFDVLTGASGCSFGVGPAAGDGVTSYTGVTGNGIYAWGAQYEVNQPFPSSYIGPTTSGSVAKGADDLMATVAWPRQDLTVYGRIARPWWGDLSGSIGTLRALCSLGSDANGFVRVYGDATTRAVVAGMQDNATPVTAAQNIPAGTELEVCAQFVNIQTAGKCRVDVGAGFGSYSALTGVVNHNGVLTVGGESGIRQLAAPLLSLKIASGARTMAEMRGLV